MGVENILSEAGLGVKWADEATLLLILLAISIAFGLVMGRFRLINVLISIYIALALLSAIPEDFLKFHDYSQPILFFLFVTMLTLVDTKLFDVHISGSGAHFFWRLFVMSFLEIGLMFSILLSLLPQKDVLEYISKDAYVYFVSPYAKLFWMAAPLIFLFMINKKLSR